MPDKSKKELKFLMLDGFWSNKTHFEEQKKTELYHIRMLEKMSFNQYFCCCFFQIRSLVFAPTAWLHFGTPRRSHQGPSWALSKATVSQRQIWNREGLGTISFNTLVWTLDRQLWPWMALLWWSLKFRSLVWQYLVLP